MYQLIDNIVSFIHMGGYAAFIWPSYAAMMIIFLFSLWFPLRQFQQIKKKLRSKS